MGSPVTTCPVLQLSPVSPTLKWSHRISWNSLLHRLLYIDPCLDITSFHWPLYFTLASDLQKTHRLLPISIRAQNTTTTTNITFMAYNIRLKKLGSAGRDYFLFNLFDLVEIFTRQAFISKQKTIYKLHNTQTLSPPPMRFMKILHLRAPFPIDSNCNRAILLPNFLLFV